MHVNDYAHKLSRKCRYINKYILRLHIEHKGKDRVHLTNTVISLEKKKEGMKDTHEAYCKAAFTYDQIEITKKRLAHIICTTLYNTSLEQATQSHEATMAMT